MDQHLLNRPRQLIAVDKQANYQQVCAITFD
jgi:hypothetical protein